MDTLWAGCKHCKTVSPWKPPQYSEAFTPPPHLVTAPSTLSKAKYPDPLNQPLACWLSSTADVQRGVDGAGQMMRVALTASLCDGGPAQSTGQVSRPLHTLLLPGFYPLEMTRGSILIVLDTVKRFQLISLSFKAHRPAALRIAFILAGNL